MERRAVKKTRGKRERSNKHPIMLKGEGLILTTSVFMALFHGCITSKFVLNTEIKRISGYEIRHISRWSAFANEEPEKKGTETIIYKVLIEVLISSKKLPHRRGLCNSLRSLCGSSMDSVTITAN